MAFRYRFVRFGPIFNEARGLRSEPYGAPETLYENELVLDVGGVCWNSDNEDRSILDHHFSGAQFPSAAAAVIHNAQRIRAKFSTFVRAGDDIWLVGHLQPDFDVHCAMYLARRLLEKDAEAIPSWGWEEFGIAPDKWLDSPPDRRLDWFEPDLKRFSSASIRVWPVLLAAYASRVDHGRKFACPRHRSLHSILYAAMKRGRDYTDETSGATEFFREVENQIAIQAKNPLFDSVLETSSKFATELALLDRETGLYQADVSRARRAVVMIQKAGPGTEFGKWFGDVTSKPLLVGDTAEEQDGLIANPTHFCPTGKFSAQVDGIYLRDPECLLFKEWARLDRENSPSGEGFVFMAIAYSKLRSGGKINDSDYVFSLDPERAVPRSLHLYNLWARLQISEVRHLHELPAGEFGSKRACRSGFEKRAGALGQFFADPWFDGSNYQCTIVPAPSQGTVIGEAGRNSDLSDDPVADLARQELELSFYGEQVLIQDLPISAHDLSTSIQRRTFRACFYPLAALGTLPFTGRSRIRFGLVRLTEDAQPIRVGFAEQVGKLLWQVLDPEAGTNLPSDFLSRHLLVNPNWIGVWSRRGAVIAAKQKAYENNEFYKLFRKFAHLSRGVEFLSRLDPAMTDSVKVIRRAERLIREFAWLRLQVALPENQLPARYFETARFGEVLEMLRAIHSSAVEKIERREARLQETEMANNIDRMAHLQTIVEWIEIFLVSVYAAHLCDMLVPEKEKERYGRLLIVGAAAVSGIVTACLVLPTARKKMLVSVISALAFFGAALFLLPEEIPESVRPAIEWATERGLHFVALAAIAAVILWLVLILKASKRGHDRPRS